MRDRVKDLFSMTAAQECWIITLAPIHVKLAAQANYRLTCNFKEMYTKLDKDFKIMPGAFKNSRNEKKSPAKSQTQTTD